MAYFLIGILTFILRSIVVTYGHVFFSIHRVNHTRIPAHGGAMLVINHTSYLDFVMAICVSPRPVKFVTNTYTYSRPWLKGLMKMLNFIPVRPGLSAEAREAFNQAVRRETERGHVVVIFAEGMVSRTGQLLEFRKGVEHLSALLNVPVIPVHFDNLVGSAFSFRAGSNRMERFSLRHWRRRVTLRVGMPIHGKIEAAVLREKMKDLECESFAERIDRAPGLMRIIQRNLRPGAGGSWSAGDAAQGFDTLPESLSRLHRALSDALRDEKTVVVLLPASTMQLRINLYLFSRGICIVNADPDWDNEERLHVCRKTGASTLITSRAWKAVRCGPVEQRIIHVEDLNLAFENGRKVGISCRKQRCPMPPSPEPLPAVVFFDGRGEALTPVSLTQQNLLAVIVGLRQVQFFPKGARFFSDLPMYHSYGWVLQFLLPLVCDLRYTGLGSGAGPADFNAALAASGADTVLCTPAQLRSLAAAYAPAAFPTLVTVFTADIDPRHPSVAALEQTGLRIYTCAGLNRTSSVCCVNTQDFTGVDIAGEALAQPGHAAGTIGKPLPGLCMRPFSPHGKPAEWGRLYVRGAAVARSSEGSAPEGWVATPWEGQVLESGFVQVSAMAHESLATGDGNASAPEA